MSKRQLPSLSDYDAWDYTGTYSIHTIDLDALTIDTIAVDFD